MRFRDRREERPPVHAPDGSGGGSDLASASERAERLLDATDRAIERSLSPDSEAFLRNRQQIGGQ